MQTTSPEISQRALLYRGGPAATWGNLGLWDGANTYAEACAALAIAVGKAAGILPGERALSLACGAGDELAVWIEHFEAQSAVGLEANAGLADVARRKFDPAPASGRITVFEQSALDPQGLPAQGFDRVVCVDAAYHLAPRSHFLDNAFRCLRPGGRLAFTDLLPGAGVGAMVRAGARPCGIDPAELATPAQAVARLSLAGFESPVVEPLDARVLEGFARFVLRQTRLLGRDALRCSWRKPLATALLIRAMLGAGPGYGLISATRPVA